MRKLFPYLMFLLCSGTLMSQTIDPANHALNAVFGKERTIYIKFRVENRQQQDMAGRVVDISGVQGNEVYAYADKVAFARFLDLSLPYEVLPYPRPASPKMFSHHNLKNIAAWDSYPTYSAYEALMAQFAASYPAICDIDTILDGTPNGHRILVAHISSNVNTPANKPQFLYTSSMHGNELTGFVLMLHLIDYLTSNYGSVARVTNLVNNVDIWINPLANPDGAYLPNDNTISGAVRENYYGADLNRSFPNPDWVTDPNPYSIQPETQAFMDFADLHHFNMSANFHDGAELLNYPYDSKSALAPDDSWWERTCRQWADTVHINTGALGSTYFSDLTNGVTNGFAWYYINGGRQDYMGVLKHCREVTVEMSYYQPPAGADLPDYWNAQHRSLLKYMEESQFGIRGIITDSCTGLPIRAKVFVNGHDVNADSSFVYSALPVGNYHRYLINGTYSVTFSAPGYQSKTITGVVVTNGSATIRNIVLRPTLAPVAEFSSDVQTTCDGTVNFINQSGNNTSSWLWKFGDGTTSTLQNPVHTYTSAGTYTVELSANNCLGTDSIVKTSYITVNLITTTNTVNDTSCGPGSVNLSAQSTGTVQWFDSPSGGQVLSTGNTYSPVITSTTTYYAQGGLVYPQQSAGKPDNTGATGGYNSSGDHYLIFDCTDNIILDSVSIYGNPNSAPGSKTIELRTSTGTVLASATVNLTSGLNKVYLGFNVPIANNLRLACTGGGDLFRHNNGGLSYPYLLSGILSVKSSDQGTNYYYYFFNWRVHKPGCPGVRVPVYAVLTPQASAGFTSIVNSATADFTNTSTNATGWLWDFGDGGSSTAQHPSHTYTSTGTYNVMLIAYGCDADTFTQQVTISVIGIAEQETFGQVIIYPNPVTEKLNISIGAGNREIMAEVYDIRGTLVFSAPALNPAADFTIDLSAFDKGVYLLKLRNSSGTFIQRVVKL